MDDLVRHEGVVWAIEVGRAPFEDYHWVRDVIRETVSVSLLPLLPSYTTDGISKATTSHPS